MAGEVMVSWKTSCMGQLVATQLPAVDTFHCMCLQVTAEAAINVVALQRCIQPPDIEGLAVAQSS
jgi:hypothetical protein